MPVAALRVVVGATRDVELAVARQRHLDLMEHIGWIEARHEVQIVALDTENRRLRRRLEISQDELGRRAEHLRRVERRRGDVRDEVERNLTRSANDLVGYISRAEVRMPGSVLQAIWLMRRGGYDEEEVFPFDDRTE